MFSTVESSPSLNFNHFSSHKAKSMFYQQNIINVLTLSCFSTIFTYILFLSEQKWRNATLFIILPSMPPQKVIKILEESSFA